MTLDQIRIFLEVARELHVTRAAGKLNLTQSTVSAAIKTLEERYGVQLFARLGRGVTLTAEGRIFQAEAERLMIAARHATQVLDDLSGALRGEIAIICSQTVANGWLPPRLVAFHATAPAIVIGLKVGNTSQCVAAIANGTADLAFIEAEVAAPYLVQTHVATDRLALLVGNRHPWVMQPPTDLAALYDARWILRESGSGTRSTFEDYLRANGHHAPLPVFLELPSNESVCAAVAGSSLATVISLDVARPYLATGEMVEIPLPLPPRQFHMIRHKDRTPSRATSELIRHISKG